MLRYRFAGRQRLCIRFNRKQIVREKNLCPLNCLKAPCANVIVYYFALVVNVGNLLNVCLKGPSRSSFGVAYVVAGGLTLTAYATYS